MATGFAIAGIMAGNNKWIALTVGIIIAVLAFGAYWFTRKR